MRMEWNHETRGRISTIFFISTISLFVLALLNALSFNIIGESFGELNDYIFHFLGLGTVYIFIISGIFWVISENVKTRRMDRLKRMIEQVEESETGKYVKTNAPPYILADSVDRLILGAIHEYGGDYLSVSTKLHKSALPGNPDQVNNSLVKLYLLGLIDFDWEYEHIMLTSMGVDAVHIPVSLFMTKLPPHIWEEVLVMKRAIQSGDWKSAVIGASRALEAAMKDKLSIAISHPDAESDIRLKALDIEKITLYDGIRLLADLGLVRKNGLEWHLFESIRYIRNPQIHHSDDPTEFELEAASNCDIYISLLLRAWYSTV
jgi:hypothetical protein